MLNDQSVDLSFLQGKRGKLANPPENGGLAHGVSMMFSWNVQKNCNGNMLDTNSFIYQMLMSFEKLHQNIHDNV